MIIRFINSINIYLTFVCASIKQANLTHYIFDKKHVTLILCKGSIVVFNLQCNNGTSFLELKYKKKHIYYWDEEFLTEVLTHLLKVRMILKRSDLLSNQFWYKFVKKSVDSLCKAWVSGPQSHAAITEEPAAERQKTRCLVMTRTTELQEQWWLSKSNLLDKDSHSTGQGLLFSQTPLSHPGCTRQESGTLSFRSNGFCAVRLNSLKLNSIYWGTSTCQMSFNKTLA